MRGRIDPHARYRELIAARLDRPLTRVELRALAAHVKKCAPCQALEAEYRAERGLLRALPPPLPPRDLWARTSASLDREVARAYSARRWRKRLARRSAQPSTSLMTAVAAIGVTAAIAVLQLSPAIGPSATLDGRPTPLAVTPQQITLVGVGGTDVAVYRTELSEVCPANGPQDCVQTENYVRTPVNMPVDMRAGNLTLSPNGSQLALVGHYVGEDVIAVVQMPPSSSGSAGGNDANPANPGGGDSDHPSRSSTPTTDPGDQGSGPTRTRDPNNAPSSPVGVATDAPGNDPGAGNGGDQPTSPPASAVNGLTVLAILDNVQSAGAPPDWAANGEVLAFSAIPDDESRGPDVYVWSPGDAKAQAITNDHASFFASWSGRYIVISRLAANGRPHTFVIDPRTHEERAVSGPQLWLPSVNSARSQAIGWFGQLDASGPIPTPRSGALYLMDWASVDPFGALAQPDATPGATTPAATKPASDPTAAPDPTAIPDLPLKPDPTLAPDATLGPDPDLSAAATDAPDAPPEPVAEEPTLHPDPDSVQQIPTPEPARSQTPDDGANAGTPPDTLIPLEPNRDARAAPVVDWQAHWSADDAVLGVWIADSAGSSWGRLAVFAVDQTTQRVSRDNPLLSMTMARRGFSLGANRVAWVGPSDDSVDGELRIRTWGSDGVGGLRLKAPESNEVVPAS